MRRILERLGEDATYTPAGGGASSTVRGFFQQPYMRVDFGPGAAFESSDPSFTCMQADVVGVAQGATFVRASTTWKVKEVAPDKVSGLVFLPLQAT